MLLWGVLAANLQLFWVMVLGGSSHDSPQSAYEQDSDVWTTCIWDVVQAICACVCFLRLILRGCGMRLASELVKQPEHRSCAAVNAAESALDSEGCWQHNDIVPY